jgi:hypothetical protein
MLSHDWVAATQNQQYAFHVIWRRARDLDILCADGVYDLAHVVPLDMFPQNATCRVRGGFAAKSARDAQ